MEQESNQRLAQLAHVSRLATMGELVSELAHELNQPLYAIANFSQACLNVAHNTNSPHTRQLLDWLEQISAQSQRAGDIIRRVYSYVRKAPAQTQVAEVNDLVNQCAQLLQVNLRHQEVALRLKLADALPEVSVDPVQIQQVLVNLMSNAIDAMSAVPRAERQLTVCTQRGETGEIEVGVCDRGRGTSEENLERLFEPFFSTKSQGMGMGLAISRSIVEAHGGRLWAEKNRAAGLTFHFTLPIYEKEP
jgi:two-component system sensor kinase FixL